MEVEGDGACKSKEESKITGIMHKACVTYHQLAVILIVMISMMLEITVHTQVQILRVNYCTV